VNQVHQSLLDHHSLDLQHIPILEFVNKPSVRIDEGHLLVLELCFINFMLAGNPNLCQYGYWPTGDTEGLTRKQNAKHAWWRRWLKGLMGMAIQIHCSACNHPKIRTIPNHFLIP
jgi:hypothetical protein